MLGSNEPAPLNPRDLARPELANAGVALAYFVAALLGLELQLPGTNASPVWPPSGIGLAAVLVFGLRVWPGILVAAFLANFLTLPFTSAGAICSALIAVGNTLEHVAAWLLIRRLVATGGPFDRARDVFWFVLTAAGSCAIASTVGATALWSTGIVPAGLLRTVWFTWWLGDTAGMLVLTPAIYCWWRSPRLGLCATRAIELLSLAALTALTAELLFGGWIAAEAVESLPYLVVPGLLWAAFRFSQRETSAMAVLVSVIAIVHTWQWMREGVSGQVQPTVFVPFVGHLMSANDSLLALQIFVCAIAVTAITLAAAMTERTSAERALADSERRFRTIFEQAAVGVALIETPTGRLVRINQRYCDLVGYSPDEMTGMTFMQVTHPDDIEQDLAHMHRLVAGDIGEFTIEKRYYRKDGSIVWVNLTVSPTWRPGERAEYHIAVVEDVSDRKQAEQEIRNLNADLEQRVRQRTAELARSNVELEQFAYIASHDLKQPLRTVASFAQLLQQHCAGKLDPQADDYLHFIQRGTNRMQSLVNDLLALSRVESRARVFEPTDCAAVVDAAIANLKQDIAESSATVSRDSLPTVASDASQLLQVFQNLIDNAIKFRRPDRPPVVHVAAESRRGAWVFSVRDNGIGISPEHIEDVFLPFRRLHTEDEYPGTGMGLAICKKIIERHGGAIWVESRPGEGSEFCFTMPTVQGDS